MPRRCALGCTPTKGVLHIFPNPDKFPDQFKAWVKIVSGKTECDFDCTKKRVCDRHFTEKDQNRNNRLNKLAIPSLFLPFVNVDEQVQVTDTLREAEAGSSTSNTVSVEPTTSTQLAGYSACGGADVSNSADTAGPAHSADITKPADVTNAADIKDAADIINAADITNTADITKAADIIHSADIHDGAVITDIADGNINDGDIQEETEEQLFSWQRDSEINCDHFDINPDNTIATVQDSAVIQTEYGDTIGGSSLEETRSETEHKSSNKDEEKDLHEGYKCDMCNGPIYRFRYSCVECANYDLCGACEARAAHPQHYLLRVPRPRPHGEIKLIMDTIRRFLTADLKSLRAEANFVNTLMDELKSEVLSEAGSDPVPHEPDYLIQLDDSTTQEHEDCEMESNATHSSAKKIDIIQDITWLDEDILEENEIPPENSDVIETKDSNDHNDRGTDSNAKLKTECAHIQHKPEKRKIYEIDSLSSSSTSGKVSKKIFVTCPKKVLIRKDVHTPLRRIVKIDSPSPSNASDKESKNILATYPKKVTISNDVLRLVNAKNEAVKMQTSMKTTNTGVQRKVCIQVKRLSKEELKSVQQIHDSNT